MLVNWGGIFESKDGKEKMTLYIPDGCEDQAHSLKMAARRGEKLELRVMREDDQTAMTIAKEVVESMARLNDTIVTNLLPQLQGEEKKEGEGEDGNQD